VPLTLDHRHTREKTLELQINADTPLWYEVTSTNHSEYFVYGSI